MVLTHLSLVFFFPNFFIFLLQTSWMCIPPTVALFPALASWKNLRVASTVPRATVLLVRACRVTPRLPIRWGNPLVCVTVRKDGLVLNVINNVQLHVTTGIVATIRSWIRAVAFAIWAMAVRRVR